MAKDPIGLYKRGNIYWFRYTVPGGQERLSLKTSDLAQAITKVNQIPRKPRKGSVEPVASLIASFIATKLEENRFTEATRRAAIVSLNKLAAYTGDIAVTDITRHILQKWFEGMRKSSCEHTAQTHLNRARSFFKWAYQIRLIIENPTRHLNIGRLPPPRRIRFATDEQRKQLIENVPVNRPDLKFILFAGFYAGMRKNEINAARKNWFDLERGTVTVPSKDGDFQSKDRRERTIPLAPSFLTFLKTYEAAPDDYMIGQDKAQRGASIYRYDFRSPFTKYMKAQDMEWITAHVLRHTFASLLASKDVDIYKIAIWMGDNVRTVQKHYAKLLPITDVSMLE